jgi:hypothetical protein
VATGEHDLERHRLPGGAALSALAMAGLESGSA